MIPGSCAGVEIIKAKKVHATDLAYLINLAGEGIPEYLWRSLAEGDESALEVGAKRASRDQGSFSYLNAKVCVEDNEVLGMIISYQQPDPYDLSAISDYPEIVRPMVLLEAQAPGSWYINALATFESHRGKGVARHLVADAERQAEAAHCNAISIIVSSANTQARELYDYLGYSIIEAEPVVEYPGCLYGGDWLLMTKVRPKK